MSFYSRAASVVLDMLWERPDFRDHFHALGVDLAVLGRLTPDVFAPAYLAVKRSLDAQGLALLEAQVTEDLLAPYYNRPGFKEIWDAWDNETRTAFVREQSEEQLARRLLQFHTEAFAAAYRRAYDAYRGS